MSNFWGNDDWDRPRRRPSPHHVRSDFHEEWLQPGVTSSLHRSRSQGHGPQPVINVYNRMNARNDNDNANDNRSRSRSPYPAYPPYPPFPPQMVPQVVPQVVQVDSSRRASPRASPERRGRSRLNDSLTEALAELALDGRYRSRSRGRSDVSPAGLAEWQLAQKEQELRDLERRKQWELEEEHIRADMKIKQIQEQLENDRKATAAQERERRAVADYERKKREEDDAAKDRQKRYELDLDRKRREEEEAARDRQKRFELEYERKQREEKEKEEQYKLKVEREQREAKEKAEKLERDILQRKKEREEEAERQFIARQEQKEREKKERMEEFKREQEKEKAKEKQKEEEFQNEMRKRLAHLGYTEKTIEIMIDEEKAAKFKTEVEAKNTGNSTRLELFERGRSRAPVYPKVHRDFLAVETLRYYDLPWEYDRANPEYIIILRDMDKRETDVLFEHTTRLRSKLLLEPAKKENQYAWVRHRSKSRGAKDRIGILKYERVV